RGKFHGPDRALVSAEGSPLPEVGGVPDLDSPFRTCRGQHLAVGRKRQVENPLAVRPEGTPGLSRLAVPEGDHPVSTFRDKGLAIRCESRGVDPVRLLRGDGQLLARADVPQLQMPLVVQGEERLAVRGKPATRDETGVAGQGEAVAVADVPE